MKIDISNPQMWAFLKGVQNKNNFLNSFIDFECNIEQIFFTLGFATNELRLLSKQHN